MTTSAACEALEGTFELTSSPLTATDGELFTLTCSFRDESAANIGWLQNNKHNVVTQKTPNCIKRALTYGHDIINRINVSCSTTAHSMTFRFSSNTDQGSAWQCGNQVSDYVIHPRSNNYTIGTRQHDQTLSPVMSQSLLTMTRSMETTSDPEAETIKQVTEEDNQSSSPVMTTATRPLETTLDPEAETLKQAFTVENDTNLLYIVVGAVGGAVLLTVLVVGVVCIRRRRKSGHAYASSDMPVTNTCTPREEVPSGDVNLENLYAKLDKSKHTDVQHEIYAEVQKPKKRKQDDPMVSEDFNTGDVYAIPNKGLKAQK